MLHNLTDILYRLFEFLSEIRMGDVDQGSGPLPVRPARQFRNPVLGDNDIRIKPGDGYHGAVIQKRDDGGRDITICSGSSKR